MKKELLPLLLSILLISCQSQQTEELADRHDETETIISRELVKEDSIAAPSPERLCFEEVVGLDRTELSLTIKGDAVTGNFNYLPHEKDQAIGKIIGRYQDNSITAVYTYFQEGDEQSEQLVLTLSDDQVIIKHTGAVSADGETNSKDDGSSYTETLPKIACK